MLKYIYLFMQYNLQQLLNVDNTPVFNMIDRFKHQPEHYNKERETLLPAAYVSIKKADNIKEFGAYMIQAEYEIDVIIATERYTGSELGDATQDESLDLYYLVDKVSGLYNASMEDMNKQFKEYLYFPPTGVTGGISYDYENYLIGYLHLVSMQDISGRYDDLDVYEVKFKVNVNNKYNMINYITLSGITLDIQTTY